MTSQSKRATNARILRLLEEVKVQLAKNSERQEQMARDLARLLSRK